jgi:hypothetical protein
MIRICTAGPAGIVVTRNIGAWADHDQGIKKDVGKFCRREYLEVIDVSNLLVRIDVNPNGRHSSLLGFNHANAFDLPRGGYAVPHDRTRCPDPGNQSIRRTFRT